MESLILIVLSLTTSVIFFGYYPLSDPVDYINIAEFLVNAIFQT